MKVCPVCSTEYSDDVKFCKNDGSALRASGPAADLVGQIVAERYHVIKKLGEGGMGQVYLAEHVKMGRRSAIKVLNPSLVHDPDAIARFNREASSASRISHPNVCAIYDFGETPDGLIYLAMEFVEGEPLTDLLEREETLPLERAAGVFLQVADALQAAHDLGIVHRDLKPDNIMVARGRAGADVVKVVDFGIAKLVGGAGGGGDQSQKVTKTGLVIGTPEYMSPEQLAGDALDGRSDLYSLALVFFRMLTGRLPFEADTVQETMVQRLTDEPLHLAAARPDLPFPPGLQACFDSALARAPVERYQTVARFAADVGEVLGIAAGTAAAGVPRTRSGAEARTQLIDEADTRVLGRRSTPPTRPSKAPPTPPRSTRRRTVIAVVTGAVLVLGLGSAAVALFSGDRDMPGPVAVDDSGTRTVNPAADDTQRLAKAQATDPVTDDRPEVGRPRRDTRRNTQPQGVSASEAGELLYRLIEARPRAIIDSAPLVYAAPNVSPADRAFAACLLAEAHAALGNTRDALTWADRGLALDSRLSSCRNVISRLRGP